MLLHLKNIILVFILSTFSLVKFSLHFLFFLKERRFFFFFTYMTPFKTFLYFLKSPLEMSFLGCPDLGFLTMIL